MGRREEENAIVGRATAEREKKKASISEPKSIAYLIRNFLLVLCREIHKVVVLCAHQDRNRRLIKAPSLPIPLLDTVQGALPRQVEHEQNSDCIVANQRQHIDKLALATQIPDGESDFRVSDRDGLLHEVDAKSLNIVFVPAALHVFDHERRFANLRVPHHAHLDHHMVTAVGRFT